MESKSYVDPNKHRWQRIANLTAWDRLLSKPISLRRVVYLDTREALQTITLLEHGYDPKNLLAVNREPVELALLTQRLDRLEYPRILTYSGSFPDQLPAVGPVDILDYDGTSNMCGSAYNIGLVNGILCYTPTLVSFTILAGRESKTFTSDLQKFISAYSAAGVIAPSRDSSGHIQNPNHWWRLLFCAHQVTGYRHEDTSTCLVHILDWYWGVYQSNSRQPMAWITLRLEPHRHGESAQSLLRRNPTWLQKSIRAGFEPACVDSFTHNEKFHQVSEDGGMPQWSPEQFQKYKIPRDRQREASLFSGWPVRKE